MPPALRRPSGQHRPVFRLRPELYLADGLAAVWMAVWIGLAVWVGIDISQLRQISETVGVAGGTLVQVGDALRALSHLPLVGRAIGQIAVRMVDTGSSAGVSAQSTTSSVDQLRYLLPVVIALVPVVPTLAVWLPVRVQRRRELRAVRHALAGSGADQHVERYLARRAVSMLPFHQLEQVSDDPWADIEAGRVHALARAELRRLGVKSWLSAEKAGRSPGTDERKENIS